MKWPLLTPARETNEGTVHQARQGGGVASPLMSEVVDWRTVFPFLTNARTDQSRRSTLQKLYHRRGSGKGCVLGGFQQHGSLNQEAIPKK
jgi:hypothetical protein